MKKLLLFVLLLLTVMVARSQTVMVLNLPDPCEGYAVEEHQESTFIFSAFPNPANDKLTLQFSDIQPLGKLEVTLSDAKGVVLKRERFYSSYEGLQTDLNIKDLAPGVYILDVKGKESHSMKRIVKM